LNSIENAARNNCKHITVYEGDASLLVDQRYELIIANINRNILLADMAAYSRCLLPGGTLLLSGFYEEDIPFLEASCIENGLHYVSKLQRNNWVSLKFEKPV
jgi:ribosomal protein L11 methyltransferase